MPAPDKQSVFMAYQETRGFLKKYLRRYYTNADDIEDAMQEGFLKTFEIEQKQTIQSPAAYLFMAINNFARRDLKKKSRHAYEPIEDIELTGLSIDITEVESGLEARQKLIVFCEAIDSLPPQCRKAFLLRKMHGLSHKEIAETMGISVSTVEKHLAKGLQRSMDYMARRNTVDMSDKTNTASNTWGKLTSVADKPETKKE